MPKKQLYAVYFKSFKEISKIKEKTLDNLI